MPHLLIRPPFPKALDSTMLKAFRSCPQLFYKEFLLHYKPRSESIHLIAGKAFASGLEAMRRAYYQHGQSAETALGEGLQALVLEYGTPDAFVKEAKSLERMCGALEYYATAAFPLEFDEATPMVLPSGARAIEFSFALEFSPRLVHPETGEPLLYSGRCDQIVDYAGGRWPEDDKTTSQLGASWANQWSLRSQFTGYAWAARQFFENIQGVLVTGIAIRKTGYDHQRHSTPRMTPLIELWYEQTERDLLRMIECWKAGYFDYTLDEACGSYGGCIFREVCGREDEAPWLDAGFVKREWNPIARMETELEGQP